MFELPPRKRRLASALPEFPANLLEFQRMFPDEGACWKYLEHLRWPSGFACERCGAVGEPFRLATRRAVLKCRTCRRPTSVTAGTVLHRTRTPLLVWFWAAYLVATQTPGISALELQRQLGLARYETAFQLLHKLRAATVRPDRDPIGTDWPVEMDLTRVGGRNKGGGRGKTTKAAVAIAVEVRRKEQRDLRTGKLVKRAVAGQVRLRLLPSKAAAAVDRFAKDCIAPGACVATDDGGEFQNLRQSGFRHRPLPMRGSRSRMDAWLPMLSTVTANLKTWLAGTFHGVSAQHLQTYLDEFAFRFNRRFHRAVSFRTLLSLGINRSGPTYQDIYAQDRSTIAEPSPDAECVLTGSAWISLPPQRPEPDRAAKSS